jgi:PAS domain S-box-containing protein
MNRLAENPATVLIVNDDQVQLDLLRDLINPEGYKTFLADSARRALEITAVARMDIIVCDVVMPEMNGIELCRRLKQDPHTATIPILLVSAIRKEDAALLEGFAAGADDYIEIPFRHEELLVKVARLAERHRVERRYRDIVEQAADIIYTRDMDGLIRSVNEAGARFFGRPAFELIGQPLSVLIGEEAAARDIAAMKDIKTFEPIRFTHCLNNALGEERHLEGIVTIERNSQGEGLAVRGVVRDVTERRHAEAALEKQSEEYRLLFESNPCPMYVCDENSLAFLAVNQAAVDHYGYSREEFLKMTVLDIRPREEVPGLLTYLAKQMRSEHQAAGTWRHQKKDGSVIDVDVNWHRLDFAGRPAYLVMANDITEKKHAQIAVLESEERYRELFENANDIIYTIDLAGNFTSLNRTGERLTGYARAEALTMNITEVVAPDQIEIVHQNLARKLETNDVSSVYETEIITRSGRRLPLELSSRVIYREGKPIGVQGIARDITDRKQVQSALAQQGERAALINRISQAVRRTLDVSEVFETAVHELGTHLRVDRCSLFMKDEKAGRVSNAAEYHVSDVEPAGTDFELPRVQGLNESMEKHGVMAFDDVAGGETSRRLYEGIVKRDVKSIMYVGISVGNELLGAFALSTTKELRHWSDTDIEVAKAAADQTGIAIRQARLYQRAEATSMREALVNKLSVAIRASLSLASMLDTATRELTHALSASRVEVRLDNSNGDHSIAQGEYLAQTAQPAGSFDLPHNNLLRGRFLRSQAPVIINDAAGYEDEDTEFSSCIREHAASTGVLSQIDYPLFVNGEFRGVISIHQTEKARRWTEDEVLLVEAVAAQMATGIAQAELFEMVARAKKEWESTFDAMSDGIFIFDKDGKLVRVNRAGAAMDNAPPETLLGQQCCDILRTSSDGIACIVEQALRKSASINLEIVPQNLNRPVLVTVEPVLDERSQTIGAVCTARDLSELRQVEAVARERQSLLKNIMDSAREAIYALDSEGRYKWCNQAMLEMTGYKLDEIIGHSFLERTHEDDREMRLERFTSALNGYPQSFESRYVARSGSVRFASVNTAPIIVDGETTGVLGIAHDITEQKEERDRAARADKLRALGQLASGVAHDFNNSLAAILGRAQLILRRVKDEEIIRSLGIIVTAAEDAAATVRRIQTFARKSVAAELELLDVGGLLRDAIEITRTRWENEARAAGLNVYVTLNAEDGSLVCGNASELREVFVNLIVNAVDAMPEGGSLKICCNKKGARVQLRLADTGTGMKEDVRERVFEPFYTTKGVHGTGLGLAVSYGILERHQGMITVESKLGKGTTFYIDLPAAENVEVPVAEIQSTATTHSLSILVIDDEEFVRETLAEMLADLDHHVVTADSGRSAAEKIAEQNFDVVFTDLAMPEMDGWETARAVRALRPDLPVVLVTGYGATAQPPSGELDLVAGIIGKPFDFDQVTATLVRVCGRSEQPSEVSADISLVGQ